jgi:pyrroloquinoline quinone (PQQ) biosynthesis protein C
MDDRKALPADAFIRELKAGLREPHRDRTNHPFVQKVLSGEATLRQVGGWLLQFRLWADPSNKGIAVLWANTPDAELREALLENLLEEEHGATSKMGGGHVALINDALEECGFTRKEVETADLLPESWAFYHWWEVVLKNRSFVEGLAALSMAAEQINPIVFGALAKGLRAHYPVTERGLRAFDVHASEVEVEHGRIGEIAIERYATTHHVQQAVRFAVYHTAELYYRFFNTYTAY